MSERVTRIGRHSARLTWLRRVVRREEPDLTVLDGVKLIRDLAVAGAALDAVFATPERYAEVEHKEWFTTASGRPPVFLASVQALDQAGPSQSSQGLLAVARVPSRPLPVAGVVLYLDRVQEPGNVGSVIRSAAAFGAAAVACSPACSDPFSPRAVRASAGQALLLPVAANQPFGDLAQRFRSAGGRVAAASGEAGTTLSAWGPEAPLLIALGSEGQGLSPEVRERCSEFVRIPLAGGVESLNVAVAAGVILASLAGVAGAPILGLRHREGGLDDPSS